MTDAPAPASKRSPKRMLLMLLKWGLCLLVLGFVIYQGYQLSSKEELAELHVDYLWLISAGLIYIVGWLPSVWFWRALMKSCGAEVSWWSAIRAYYCGHLGKYVPGKAMVLVIRTALVKNAGCRPALAALTATCETLMMMGTGLVVVGSLFPLVFTEEQRTRLPDFLQPLATSAWILPSLVIGLTVLCLPIIARLVTLVGRKMTPVEYQLDRPIVIRTSLLFQGLLMFGICWIALGLSLGFVLKSLQPDLSLLDHFWTFVAACAVATSIGFLALFAPGGVGVREGLLMWSLTAIPEINPAQAVAAAVLLRLVWLAFEILTAALLYYYKGSASNPA
ncbi:MAG: flippase-like domain-containing protein [Planctomycetaceae bacterium]|nr:flippase-like domain-containing protein [Planctomycetaceae bacterium]